MSALELATPGMPEATPRETLRAQMFGSAAELIESAQRAGWRGSDPHDGLYWGWPGALVSTRRRRQAIVQLHVRSPVDVRFWRRGPRPRLAKTLALFTKAALLISDPRLRETGRSSASALYSDHSAGPDAWGYPFAVQTRWSHYPVDSPNVVVTAFAIDALLLAAEMLDDPKLAARAHRAGRWIADRLRTPAGYFAYHERSDVLIHNASLLGAVAVYRTLGETELVSRAVELTLEAQRKDGAWAYGERSNLRFADSFHTGYVLSALLSLRATFPEAEEAIRRGAAFWTEQFFDDKGRALMWPDRALPEDAHSAGTALSTLALLAEIEPSYRDLLVRVATRVLAAMVKDAHAVHRRYRWGRTYVNYLRWCDGHVAVGLAAAAPHVDA